MAGLWLTAAIYGVNGENGAHGRPQLFRLATIPRSKEEQHIITIITNVETAVYICMDTVLVTLGLEAVEVL